MFMLSFGNPALWPPRGSREGDNFYTPLGTRWPTVVLYVPATGERMT